MGKQVGNVTDFRIALAALICRRAEVNRMIALLESLERSRSDAWPEEWPGFFLH